MPELTKDDLQVIAECLDIVRRQCAKESLANVYGVMVKVDALLAAPAEAAPLPPRTDE